MLLKSCTQYVSKFGKLSSGHRAGKGQFSSQPQRRTVPKNVHTTIHLYSLHMLVRLCSQARFQQYMNQELPLIQTGFRIGRGTRDQIAKIHWFIEEAI